MKLDRSMFSRQFAVTDTTATCLRGSQQQSMGTAELQIICT